VKESPWTSHPGDPRDRVGQTPPLPRQHTLPPAQPVAAGSATTFPNGGPDDAVRALLAPWLKWHPPGIRTTVPQHYSGDVLRYLQPLTGREQPPQMPAAVTALGREANTELWQRNRDLAALVVDTVGRIEREIRAVQIGLAVAVFLGQVTDIIRKGLPLLNPYVEACQAADDAYAAMRTTALQGWPAGLMRLVESRALAIKAAHAVQSHADHIESLTEGLHSPVRIEVPSLEEIARRMGVDMSGWPEYEEVLADTLTERYADQDTTLRAVAALMPQPVEQ